MVISSFAMLTLEHMPEAMITNALMTMVISDGEDAADNDADDNVCHDAVGPCLRATPKLSNSQKKLTGGFNLVACRAAKASFHNPRRLSWEMDPVSRGKALKTEEASRVCQCLKTASWICRAM